MKASKAGRPAPRIDPITARIVLGALDGIATEMGHKLVRMARSSIIRESEDFGAAICDAEGRQLCECKQSTPLQCGPIPGYVRGIMRLLAERGDAPREGDVFLHNDPYAGASHSPDIGVCVPIFHSGVLVGFSVTTAHHLDIGAGKPGSVGVIDCPDVFGEGLRLRALRVQDAAGPNGALWSMIADNVRVPDLTVGDLKAQVAVSQLGAMRYGELLDRFGDEVVSRAAEDLFDYSDRLMRAQIEKIPDGVYSAEGVIDGFVDEADPTRKFLTIRVAITVAGGEMTVDFAGSAPQVSDRPINMPFIGTVDVAVWLALRSILLDSAVFGDIAQNAGLYRAITITAPKGSIANPIFPAPSMARAAPGNLVADTVMKALSKVAPERVSAGTATVCGVAYYGVQDAAPWVHMEIYEGSYGGRLGLDGMDAVDTLYANTRNNPIEDIESHYPLRVTRYELRDGVCTPGRWRGGLGVVKSIEFLADGAFGIETDGTRRAAWGYGGGHAGAPTELRLETVAGEVLSLPPMTSRTAVAGDVLTIFGGSGGGYGEPRERDPGDVLSDVRDGYLSAEAARDDYAVAIIAGPAIDAAATRALRGG